MDIWKQLSKNDLKHIDTKLDHSNKALVSRQYYESNKDNQNAKDFDAKYSTLICEFVKLLHELREKKEVLHPQFVLRGLQAEIIMVRQLLLQAEQCSAAMLNFGAVDPIPLSEAFRLIARDPYPLSEDEKKKMSMATDNKNPYAQAGGGGGGYNSNPYATSPQPVQVQTVTTTYAQPLPPPVQPMQPQYPMARGLFPFNASSPQELSFNVGDTLRLLNTDGQWWQAELNGRTGMIPSNYVQRL